MDQRVDDFGHPIDEHGQRNEQKQTRVDKDYPVKLEIDYQKNLNRLTTFFRLFLAIPILIILSMLMNYNYSDESPTFMIGIGFIVLPLILSIVFVKKYPKWWYDWNFELTKFTLRINSYLTLLTDKYPSLDEDQNVHLTMPYPEVGKDIDQFMPLIKWFLAIPHYFVLAFLAIGALLAIVIAWFAILFTGKYPRSLFDFVVGVMRWGIRINAYTMLQITDDYPPFSLKY